MKFKQWEGFKEDGEWTKEIDVRGFIQANYTPYEGDENFLKGVSDKSKKLWDKVLDLYKEEREATERSPNSLGLSLANRHNELTPGGLSSGTRTGGS